MNIINELIERGIIKDFSNKEKVLELFSKKQTVYCGFDPTATSMHLGNFVPISILMRLQRAGHKVIALVGGGTGMIGDPSGKSKERNLQTDEMVLHNVECIRKQLSKYIDLNDNTKGLLVNNNDWLSKISIIEFLRDYGKCFTVNYMLAKDIVANRLDDGISFTEFTYSILQAADFYHLFKQFDCKVQFGGSDQWGNLTSGLELIRKNEGPEADVGVFTNHLVTKSDGTKFGKSEGGALYLDPKLTSPYKLYQYLLNVADEDAVKYLKVFTFLSLEEIEIIRKEHELNLGSRVAQKTLAYEVTKIVHNEKEVDEAIKMSQALFSCDVASLSEENIIELLGSLKSNLPNNICIVDALIEIKACSSKREAREFIKSNSVSINGHKISEESYILTKENALHKKYFMIKRGKKNWYLAVIN